MPILTDSEIYWLICEGACNPHLPAIDELLITQGQAADATTRRLLRRLRYTAHIRTGIRDLAMCLTCQAERRY